MNPLKLPQLASKCLGNTLFVFLLISASYNLLYGQQWAAVKKYGLEGNYQRAGMLKSVTDKDGNTYAVGYYMDKIVFAGQEHKGPYFLDNNFFLLNMDKDGNLIWVSFFDGDIGVNKLFIDNEGRVYLSGSLSGTANFGTVKLALPGNSYYQFVCVYSSNGTAAWAKFGYDVTVSEGGKIFSKEKIHNGFKTEYEWDQYIFGYHRDSLHCYNAAGVLERRIMGYWEYEQADVFKTQGDDLWLKGVSLNGEIKFSRYSYTENQFKESVLLADLPVADAELFDDAIYLWGLFDFYGDGTLEFGDIKLTAKPDWDGYYRSGFLVKYDIKTNQYAWGKTVWRMWRTDDSFLVRNPVDGVYLATRQTDINRDNNIRAYSSQGDSLWTKSSTAYILLQSGLGADQFGNVYVTGEAANGVASQATFSPLSFTYSWDVAYWAKLEMNYPSPSTPQELAGEVINASSLKLTWIDSNEETGYRLEYKTAGSTPYQTLSLIPANTTSYEAQDLDCKEVYSFRVTALGKGSSSPYSNVVTLALAVATPVVSASTNQLCIGGQLELSAPEGYAKYEWSSGETTRKVTVSAAGNYAVKVTDDKSCESNFSNDFVVTTYAIDAPTISASATTACEGESISLTAPEGFAQYHWTTGETSREIEATIGGEFSVRVVNQDGCISDYAEKVSINFHSSPEATLQVVGNKISVITEADNYQWYLDDVALPTETKNEIVPDESGNYKVEVSSHGCESFSNEVSFMITATELIDISGMEFFPNPVRNSLTIQFPEDWRFKEGNILLMTTAGKRIMKYKKDKGVGTLTLDRGELMSGLYIVQIQIEAHSFFRKVMFD